MEKRPWGWFRVLASGKGFLVKELFVEGGKRTSLQYHRHRKEVWIVVEGSGRAVLNRDVVELKEGDVVKINELETHRLEGKGNGIRIVEIWLGEELDENDIVRLEDDYGRV